MSRASNWPVSLLSLVISAVSLSSTVQAQSSDPKYLVPSTGRVTFTLTEDWWEPKIVPRNLAGDAAVTIQYSDGAQQVVTFVGTSDFLTLKIEYTGNSGRNTWSQEGLLRPGGIFSIVHIEPAGGHEFDYPVGGSDTIGGAIVGSVVKVSSNARIYSPPGPTPPGKGGPVTPQGPTNIHAVIISARSDPAKIVTSPNVTLTGGVIALGKDPSPPAKPTAQWSSGLRIVPDEALLNGAKIPPLTPNIIDVRIVKHEVTGDLLTPAP